MCDRPGTPYIKNVKLRSLKGKEPTTPIDTFSKDVTTSGNQISEWVWDVRDIESGVYFGHLDVRKTSKTETHLLQIAVIH